MMRRFSFAARVAGRLLFVEAETDSRLDDIARGEFDYEVKALFDGETGERLDPEMVNTSAAVDAMHGDAWLAVADATRDEREMAREYAVDARSGR